MSTKSQSWIICDVCGLQQEIPHESSLLRDRLPDQWNLLVVYQGRPKATWNDECLVRIEMCPDCSNKVFLSNVNELVQNHGENRKNV